MRYCAQIQRSYPSERTGIVANPLRKLIAHSTSITLRTSRYSTCVLITPAILQSGYDPAFQGRFSLPRSLWPPLSGCGTLLHLRPARSQRKFWKWEQDFRRHVRFGLCRTRSRADIRSDRWPRTPEEASRDRRRKSTLPVALAQGLGQPACGKPEPEDRNHLLGDLHFLQHDPAPGGRRAGTEDGAQR